MFYTSLLPSYSALIVLGVAFIVLVVVTVTSWLNSLESIANRVINLSPNVFFGLVLIGLIVQLIGISKDKIFILGIQLLELLFLLSLLMLMVMFSVKSTAVARASLLIAFVLILVNVFSIVLSLQLVSLNFIRMEVEFLYYGSLIGVLFFLALGSHLLYSITQGYMFRWFKWALVAHIVGVVVFLIDLSSISLTVPLIYEVIAFIGAIFISMTAAFQYMGTIECLEEAERRHMLVR